MKRETERTGDEEPKRQRVAPTDEELVAAVKVGQRVSPEWKDAWQLFCDQRQQGRPMYDPAKYSGPDLIEFFRTVGSLARQGDVPMMSRGGGRPQMDNRMDNRMGNRGGGDAQGLVTLVKAGQRACPEWREQWTQFCMDFSKGMSDPAKQAHNPSFFLAFFFKFGLGSLCTQDWAIEHLPSIANAATPLLVAAIKQGQRESPEWKDMWQQYCEEKQSKFCDPARQDASSLLEFMDTIGMTKFVNEPWMEPFVYQVK